jgi:DedD protein
VSSIPNPAAGILNPEPEKKVSSESKPETKLDIKPEVKPAAVVPAPAPSSSSSASAAPSAPSSNPASKGLGLAPGEELVVISKDVPASGEVRASANGKFVIQIGAFASEERANGWLAKLKENKIPYYVVMRNNAEGTKLFVLRAGPFAEREAAEQAEKRIRALGLSPRLVELNKS